MESQSGVTFVTGGGRRDSARCVLLSAIRREGIDWVGHVLDPIEIGGPAKLTRKLMDCRDVVILGQDGFELIESIQDVAGSRSLPIVIVTKGERTPQLYGKSLELGVNDFLCKPVTGAQILEAVLALTPNDGKKETQAPASVPTAKFFEGSLTDQPLPPLLGRLHVDPRVT